MRKTFVSSMRGFIRNWTKLLAMSLIVALGFAFIFGVSITPGKVCDTVNASLRERHISDFDVKSTSFEGFDEKAITALTGIEGTKTEKAMSIDSSSLSTSMSFYEVLDEYGPEAIVNMGIKNIEDTESAKKLIAVFKTFFVDEDDFLTLSPSLMSEGNDRVIAFEGAKSEEINVYTLVEGSLPSASDEILIDELYHKETEKVGGEASLFGKTYKISGSVLNPLYYARSNEPDVIYYDELDSIYYSYSPITETPSLDELVKERLSDYLENKTSFSSEMNELLLKALSNISFSLPSCTDVYIRYEASSSYSVFSDEYADFADIKSKELTELANEAAIIGLSSDYSCALMSTSCRKMMSICYIIPVFFLGVSALIVSISMSRMIEGERSESACLSSLGYHDGKIAIKYLLFALLSTFLGIGLGLIVGYYLVFPIIYEAFNYPYALPNIAIASSIDPWLTLISAAAMVVIIVGIVIAKLSDTLHPLPAALMQPKSPGSGKALKIEKFHFWKKIPFRFKSSIRNLARFKKRLWMTAISVGGSTAIVFLGFALLDVVNALADSGKGGAVASSIVPVSYFLIAFAILLSALVLYNLTDMSITERSREIATLEVLGYHDGETVLYLYREIGVMAFLGIIIGVPLGLGIMRVVVYYLEFGSLSDIKWYSYLLPIVIIAFFAVAIDFLLLPKIKKIDMVTSLKSVD